MPVFVRPPGTGLAAGGLAIACFDCTAYDTSDQLAAVLAQICVTPYLVVLCTLWVRPVVYSHGDIGVET